MSVAGDQREPFTQVFSHLEKVETFAIALGMALLVLLAMFSVSMGVGSGTLAQGFAIALRAFSVCTATVFAAGATGALLGFLFGIPRLLQRPGSAQSQSKSDQQQNGTDQPPPSQRQLERERFFSSNTSFEEISDWLTKIIIGLGLVQFQTILGYLRTASLYTASYINESPVTDNAGNLADGKIAVAVTFCLIVTSLFSACLITYLETRTRLAALFTRMEVANDAAGRDTVLDALKRPITDQDATAGAELAGERRNPTKQPATNADLELATVPFSGLRSPLEMAAWGSAQARRGNFDQALSALRQATAANPGDSSLKLRLAQVLRLKGDIPGYLDAVLEAAKIDPSNPDIAAEVRSAQLDALYLTPPTSFEYAMRMGDYLATSPLAKDPTIWLYIAAARGQEYKYKMATATPEELAPIRKAVLDAIAQLVKLDPNPTSPVRDNLRRMYLPGQGTDDDLRVFYRDKQFDAALGVTDEELPETKSPAPADEANKAKSGGQSSVN